MKGTYITESGVKIGQKLVITVPLDVYFKLKEKAEPLSVKNYIELLLRNIVVREVKLGRYLPQKGEIDEREDSMC